MVKYIKPELELVEFLAVDVITESIGLGAGGTGGSGGTDDPDVDPF